MIAFTKGPWKIDRTVAPKGWVVTVGSNYDIGIVRDGSGNSENEANARLISSAPDMYDALEYVLDNIIYVNEAERDDMRNKIKAALAKARGE